MLRALSAADNGKEKDKSAGGCFLLFLRRVERNEPCVLPKTKILASGEDL